MKQIIAALLAGMMAASAQQTPPPAPAQPAQEITKFTSTSQLVVETVTVHDKNGKTIDNLTAQDFTVTENGVPQTIKFAQFQKLEMVTTPNLPPLGPRPDAKPDVKADTPPVAAVTNTQISGEAPGDIKYRDRRLLVM